jgi:hypothetical protein
MLLHDTALIFERYLRQTLRSKFAMLFGVLMPLLYLLFFGPLLTDLPLGGGGSSWQVLVPGLLLQLGLFGAAFAGFMIIVEKSHGVVERMRVTPVSRLALLLGRVLRDTAVFVFQAVLLVLAAVVMGLRAPLAGILIGFAFVALLTVSLASLSYALAMRLSSAHTFGPTHQRADHAVHAPVRPDAPHVAGARLAGRPLARHAVPLSGGRDAGRVRRLVRDRLHAVRRPGGRRPRGTRRDGGHTSVPEGRGVTTLVAWSI